MSSPKVYTVFNRPPRFASPHGGVSMTDPSYLDECNVEKVLKRVGAGDNTSVHSVGVFADVSQLGDFSTLMEIMRKANEDFEALPSSVRDRFGNDPRALVQFLSDSKNDAEAIRLGLKVKREEERTLADEVRDGVIAAKAATASAQ